MRKTLIVLILAAAVAPVALLANRSGASTQPILALASVEEFNVGALGRIEPQSEVLQVNAPSVMEPPVVEKLLVEVGDQVTAGQILARLDNNRRELADLEHAKAAVTLAEKALAQVKAGAKAGDIEAQEALIARTKQNLTLAEKQLARFRNLHRSHNAAVSEEDVDIRANEVEVLRNELRQQEATLVALREVRTVDVEEAEARLELYQAAVQRAEAELETSLIRSPIDAEILRINGREGERVDGAGGLLDLGDTRQMNVVAEIHESDILKVRLGQSAEIYLRNLNVTLEGRVIEIGRLIGRKDVLSTDPVDDTDARVVEVTIRLRDEHGEMVSGMSYAKVEVTIDTSPDSAKSSELSSSNKTSAQE
jgi:HlyD family secretion protein